MANFPGGNVLTVARWSENCYSGLLLRRELVGPLSQCEEKFSPVLCRNSRLPTCQSSSEFHYSGDCLRLKSRNESRRKGLSALTPRSSVETSVNAVSFLENINNSPQQVSELWQLLENRIQDVNGAQSSTREKLQNIVKYATQLPRLSTSERSLANRVPGCSAQVWLTAKLEENGKVYFGADSDSELMRGICSVLVNLVNGAHYEQLIQWSEDEVLSLVENVAKSSTWYTVLTSMQSRVRSLLKNKPSQQTFNPFPSLVITADDITAKGSFAEAQVAYLTPDELKVLELAKLLQEKKVGVVAHFYMDPEVQGVLVAAKKHWPHIHISDSLVMAENAVNMADAGCKRVAVLGVDFMSENVRAILDKNGHHHVPVYRMSSDDIGCSLAEAGQSEGYLEYLQAASRTPKSLHVVYINTSLETKAQAQALVPTITCTSSNVLQTILQAFAQVPGLTVWYGPDTYMGGNLAEILVQLMSMTDEEIAKVHPAHNRKSIAQVLSHLQYFHDGTCIVHDLFGKEVVEKLRENYTDAFQTAHLEVPGEMFTLAMDARSQGRGAVGSTQNILDFIVRKVQEILDEGVDASPRFVLGTEAGMITSIVDAVRELLVKDRRKRGAKAAHMGVEIIFPVSSDAIAAVPQSTSSALQLSGLQIVPGVSSGEGCSVSGGCASCVYMKMNRLDGLLRICRLIGTAGESLLVGHQPKTFDTLIADQNVAELGCEPILNMRHFQKTKKMSDRLVEEITRHGYAPLPS